MYHSRFKGTHYKAGFKYGQLLLKNKVYLSEQFIRFSQPNRLDYVAKCIPIYETYYPEILEEINGIADGQAMDKKILYNFLFSMYSYTAENFCTSLAIRKGETIYFGRNSDFVCELEKNYDSCFYQLNNHYHFIGNTTAFCQMEDGINEHGLAVGLNFIIPVVKEPGFNAGFLVRYLLEKCIDVSEALKALKKLPIGASQNLVLADKTGKMALVECNSETMNIQEVDGDGYVLATNDFHLPKMIKYKAPVEDTIHSKERYQVASDAISHCDQLDLNFMKSLLAGKYGFMCQYDRRLGMDTVWSSIYDLKALKIFRVEGNPSRKKFKEDQRLKFK